MARVLIVGASRGIGAELARQHLAAGDEVHATVREVSRPGDLAGTGARLHRLDVRDAAELAALVSAVPVLDVVVHNAGVYRGVDREELFAVNTAAPLRVVDALLDGGRLQTGGVVAFMSSGMGSRRGRRTLGDGYGESKARLNDGVRARAPGWAAKHGVVAVVLNPGWVRTDMGGPGAPLPVERSVAGMRRVLAGVTAADNGRFIDWDGTEREW